VLTRQESLNLVGDFHSVSIPLQNSGNAPECRAAWPRAVKRAGPSGAQRRIAHADRIPERGLISFMEPADASCDAK